MPLPLLVVPVLIAIVNVLGVVSTILGIIESLDALFGDGGDLADDVRYIRAEQFRQSARDLLMEIDLNHLDDIVVPDVLARVTALQAAVAGLSIPTGAGIAGDVWDHIITNQGGIGNRTARTILEQETFVNSQTFLRLAPLHVNPDFAMRLNSVVNLDFIGAFAPLAGVNVRQRGAGQSIGAYLTSVLPAWNWQQTGGIWFADAPAETLPAQVPRSTIRRASTVCRATRRRPSRPPWTTRPRWPRSRPIPSPSSRTRTRSNLTRPTLRLGWPKRWARCKVCTQPLPTSSTPWRTRRRPT